MLVNQLSYLVYAGDTPTALAQHFIELRSNFLDTAISQIEGIFNIEIMFSHFL